MTHIIRMTMIITIGAGPRRAHAAAPRRPGRAPGGAPKMNDTILCEIYSRI